MYLKVKVKPGSRMDALELQADGSLRIKVKAPPVDAKANAYLIKYLSSVLQLPGSHIRIKTGSTSGFKLIEIEAEESFVRKRLELLV